MALKAVLEFTTGGCGGTRRHDSHSQPLPVWAVTGANHGELGQPAHHLSGRLGPLYKSDKVAHVAFEIHGTITCPRRNE